MACTRIIAIERRPYSLVAIVGYSLQTNVLSPLKCAGSSITYYCRYSVYCGEDRVDNKETNRPTGDTGHAGDERNKGSTTATYVQFLHCDIYYSEAMIIPVLTPPEEALAKEPE